MMSLKNLLIGMSLLLAGNLVVAKDWQVQMLSYGAKGPMVFEPDYIKAELGDTVTFVPTQPGHHAASQLTPDGQLAWSSKINKSYTVELTQEGLTLYYCPPHLIMGMVGVIQVGEAVNRTVFEQAYTTFRKKISINPERVDAIMTQID